MLKHLLVFLGVLATVGMAAVGFASMAMAQYPVPDPMRRFFERTDNPPLECSVSRRLDRDGDVVWLQMTCRAEERR